MDASCPLGGTGMQTTDDAERLEGEGEDGGGEDRTVIAPRGENTIESCMAWPAGDGERAALLLAARWQPGERITVAFLDGESSVQERVREVAREWTGPGLARLSLAFVRPGAEAMIRISFRYQGSWSVLGTTCLSVEPAERATMNFGWLTPQSSDEALRRVVLHEFGHALGLVHEHQHPEGGIQWKKDLIYQELMGPPNYWSKETIDRNLFAPYSSQETTFGRFDPESIMMYPVKKSWTLDGFSAGLNAGLSELDQEFIHRQYP